MSETETSPAIADRRVFLARELDAPQPPDLQDPSVPTIKLLPLEASVRALGTSGSELYVLDALGQLRTFKPKDLGRGMIVHLFGGDVGELWDLWPNWKKVGDDWERTGWNISQAADGIIASCTRRGIWRQQDRHRGRGGWLLEDGGFVFHDGHTLHFSNGEVGETGAIGEHVYPSGPRAMSPAAPREGLSDGTREGEELLRLFESWTWQRPEIDPRLLLGWTIAALMGGALKVRPSAWITGEHGAGKSSLMGKDGVLNKLLGRGVIMTANTTAAGLYQEIGHDALPVAVDEIEAKADDPRTAAVIELARQSYSGGAILRGGQNHEGTKFQAMCAFLFGSILIPPLLPQDMSRLAVLRLNPFPVGSVEPVIQDGRLEEIGRLLLRRILTCWDDWPERLAAWRGYMQSLGHGGRGADQFGTLLAAADFVLSNSVPSEDEMRAIAGGMSPDALQETATGRSNSALCIDYAMSREARGIRGGETPTIGEIVLASIERSVNGEGFSPQAALRHLERQGLSVIALRREGAGVSFTKIARLARSHIDQLVDAGQFPEGVYVAFAPGGEGALSLFAGSDWQGAPGCENPFVQALERAPGAQRARQTVRIGALSCKPVLVPLRECVDVPDLDDVYRSS